MSSRDDHQEADFNAAAGEPAAAGVQEIALADLEPDPFQPRKEFNEGTIRQLADSIELHGLLQPLLVRPQQGPGSQGRYWIVAGERRYRAAKLLGMDRVACRVQPYANLTAAVAALVENVHREDLSEIDKAEALLRLKRMTGKTWDEIAGLVRLSSQYVRTLAGLLKLEEPVKELVRQGAIPARTALALKPLPAQQQVEMAQRVLSEGLSAEAVREQTRPLAPRRTRTTSTGGSSAGSSPAPAGSAPVAAALATSQAGQAASGPESAVEVLDQVIEHLEQVSGWLGEQQWSPAGLTESQRNLLHRLYHVASHLQQQAARIRLPVKEQETTEAAQRRRNPLPF